MHWSWLLKLEESYLIMSTIKYCVWDGEMKLPGYDSGRIVEVYVSSSP